MALKIGQQARKERGLLKEEPKSVTTVGEGAVAQSTAAVSNNDLEDLNTTLMGIQVEGKEAFLVELVVENGVVIDLIKGKRTNMSQAKYEFKVESSRKILSGAAKGSK